MPDSAELTTARDTPGIPTQLFVPRQTSLRGSAAQNYMINVGSLTIIKPSFL